MTILTSVIYSVGTDYMINKFDIQTNKNLKSFSVNDTYYSIHISSFEPNKIILGKIIIKNIKIYVFLNRRRVKHS